MNVIGHFLNAVADVLHVVLTFFTWIMIARAVLSWVSPDPNNGIVRFINGSTDPLLNKIRGKIPPIGMFDMSVIVVLLILMFLDSFLVGTLQDYSRTLLIKY